MTRTAYKTQFIAALFTVMASNGFSQELGGTTADKKMTAQGNPGSSPGMDGLYAPNLYDGTANINIPIYQYNAEGMDLGVSLTYNTKGVKVDEMASEIGLHFMLRANGSIFRSVKDIPDELNVNTLTTPETYTPYARFKGRHVASYENSTQAADATTYRDRESDDFAVSVGNLSFTFNIGKNRSIFTVPEKNVRVELLSSGMNIDSFVTATGNYPPFENLEFRIRDAQGNTYYFVQSEDKQSEIKSEYYRGPLNYRSPVTPGYNVPLAWVVKQITLANGNNVVYNYLPVALGQVTIFRNTQAFFIGVASESLSYNNEPANTRRKLLKDISYPDGTKVTFVYDSTGRCDLDYNLTYVLKEVNISSANSNCLRYKLSQSYFISPEVPGDDIAEDPPSGQCANQIKTRHRLRLDSISMVSCGNDYTEPYYYFGYDTTTMRERLKGGQDWFGYHNGKFGVNSNPHHIGEKPEMLIPSYPGRGGLDRTEDISKMKACILNNIKNALGGEVSFEYEAHVLENGLSGITLPTDSLFFGINANDGLRLKSITEREAYHPGNFRKTTFSYEDGQRFLTGGYFHSPFEMMDITSAAILSYTMGSVYITPHQFVNGSNHGYGKVTILTQVNGVDQLSRKVITFSNFKDALSNNLPKYSLLGGTKHYFQLPYTDKQYIREWEMGLPLTTEEYDQNDKIVQRTENRYLISMDSTSSNTMQVQNEKVMKTAYHDAPIIDTFPYLETEFLTYIQIEDLRTFADTYRPYRGKALLKSTTTKKYVSDNTSIKDSVAYAYDSRGNLDYILTWNSKGDAIKTDQVYNYNVQSPLGSTVQIMTQAGLEKTIGMERWMINSGGANTFLLDASVNAYDYNGLKLAPKNLYKLSISDPLSITDYLGLVTPYSNFLSAFNNQPIAYFEKVSEIVAADNKGNPVESYLQGQDMYKAMIWDTVSGKKRAEVNNARYNDIAYSSFDNNEISGGILNLTRGNMSYMTSQVVAQSISGKGGYKLGPGIYSTNITGTKTLTAGKEYILSFWTEDGIPEVYIGSTQLTVPAAIKQVNNWKQYQVRFTPAAAAAFSIRKPASGTINVDEIRLFPSNATMQSWTYEPLFGVSSETDGTGRIGYYEYDKLGRLNVVRDQDGNVVSKVKTVVQGAD